MTKSIKKEKKYVLALFALFALILFAISSCAVQQSLSYTESYTSFTVYPFLENLTSDVASWAAFEDRTEFFEKNLIYFANNLEENYDTSTVDLRKKYDTDGPGVYGVYFSFDSLNSLSEKIKQNTELSSGEQSSKEQKHLITFTKTKTTERFDVEISLDTWEELSLIIPLLKEPNLEVYGPVYNNPPYGTKTAEEYYYMIDFIFGSGSEDIKKSNINFNFKAPNNIISTNGTIIENSENANKNIAGFSLPLIDILLLHEPIRFYCEWEK